MKRLLTLLMLCLGLLGGAKAYAATTEDAGSYLDTIYLTYQLGEEEFIGYLRVVFVPSIVSLYVDWGDGEINKVTLDTEKPVECGLSGAFRSLRQFHTWSMREGDMRIKIYGVPNIRSLVRGVYHRTFPLQNVASLVQVDLSGCTALEELVWYYFSDTPRRCSSLDMSEFPALYGLACVNLQLTELDVSKNTALLTLWCNNNQLTELDVTQNTELIYLYCENNQLTSLDLSKNTRLGDPNCSLNSLPIIMENENATFDLSKLPNFDVSRASDWSGGTVSGNILTFLQDTVTYKYDTRHRLDTYRYQTFTIIRNITMAMPVITPGSGAVEAGTTVTISCATSNAVIHYTTDGSMPTEESAVYTEPIVINTAMTIKAMAVCENYVNSAVAEASYTIMPEAAIPVITPISGVVEAGTTVTISCATSNAVIHYTTDGSTPTEESTVYSEPIVINTAMTIKAIGVCENYVNSPVAEASYTIMPEVAIPVITPGSGAVEAGSTVTISCATDNAVIHYTTDGMAPSAQSTVYTEPIVINTAMTIKAIGVCENYVNSPVAEASFTIKSVAPIEPEKPDTVKVPVFTPQGGEVAKGATVAITCATENATVYYTTDGSTPTEQSTRFTTPIVINEAMTLKAVAVRENYVNSPVAEANFTIKPVDPIEPEKPDTVKVPVFTPQGGEVAKGATVAITCATANATIYYTTDGSTPTEQSTRFTTPIVINEEMTLKAIAVRENYVNSPVATATFTIKPVDPVDPVANEAGQSLSLVVYAQNRTICISEAAGEVSVYTVDGRRVFCGNATRIPVSAGGIYIVHIAGKSYKLPVR